MDYANWYRTLPCAGGTPPCSGRIKSQPEDFVVGETLSFDLADEGDHVYLHIRKRDLNTDEVARKIARLARVGQVDLGYAGKKDRRAITEQWFSVHLPGRREVDWTPLNSDRIELLEQRRHARKLRIGALAGNTFRLVVRQIDGDRAALEARLQEIESSGVPNYFGAQRFGIEANNLVQAMEMFATGEMPRERNLRGLLVSAARSFLFNEILARRVGTQTWNQLLDGDVLMLDGSASFFRPDPADPALAERLSTLDIHPSGALWGDGSTLVEGACCELEQTVIDAHPVFAQGLVAQGLRQERRALRLGVKNLTWTWLDDHTLQLVMTLPAGSYATAVLRELFRDADETQS